MIETCSCLPRRSLWLSSTIFVNLRKLSEMFGANRVAIGESSEIFSKWSEVFENREKRYYSDHHGLNSY